MCKRAGDLGDEGRFVETPGTKLRLGIQVGIWEAEKTRFACTRHIPEAVM